MTSSCYFLFVLTTLGRRSYIPISSQITTKIQSEYTRGHLGDHQANDHYKQTKAIHYQVFHDTASQMGLLKDRPSKRQAVQATEGEPTVQIPLTSTTDESAPNDLQLNDPSSSTAPKLSRRMGRSKKSELVNAEDERMVLRESSQPHSAGRPGKSDLANAQKVETKSTVTTSPRRGGRRRKSDLVGAQGANSNVAAPCRRVGRMRASEQADTRKEGMETARKDEHFNQPEELTHSIETASIGHVESPRKSESGDKKQERSCSSEPTPPRRTGRSKRIDNGKIKKAETLPISSHSGKTKAGKKRTTARSTSASSPGTESPPNATCVAS
jgi:hypothetical protein